MAALNRAVKIVGTQLRLAELLGIRNPSISGWRQARLVPEDRCAKIVEITGGMVTLHELRKDIWDERGNRFEASSTSH